MNRNEAVVGALLLAIGARTVEVAAGAYVQRLVLTRHARQMADLLAAKSTTRLMTDELVGLADFLRARDLLAAAQDHDAFLSIVDDCLIFAIEAGTRAADKAIAGLAAAPAPARSSSPAAVSFASMMAAAAAAADEALKKASGR